MKASIFIAESLDGFIARKNGDIDWLLNIENPDNDDYGYNDFISRIDAIIMGRVSFEKVLTFPNWLYTKKVFVLSTKLQSIPENLNERVSIISMTPKETLDYLSEQGYNNFYIDGGKTVQSFLKEDLIDEMIITTVPVILGDGIPLFGILGKELHFKHINSTVYPNGLVKNHYERIKDYVSNS
jgi:dihydrofolate reductase